MKFSGLPLALPTLSLAFCVLLAYVWLFRQKNGLTVKSFCFSFFFFALDPMVEVAVVGAVVNPSNCSYTYKVLFVVWQCTVDDQLSLI